MAFNLDYLARVSSSENNLGFRMWQYNGTSSGSNDAAATIEAAGYFNDAQQLLSAASFDPTGMLQVGDVIVAHGNDANGMYVVDTITTDVEISGFGPAASVDTANLVDDAVTTAKIADDAVTTAKIADDAVTTAKILALNVTAAKLAADAVTTAKILDANVTSAKLAADTIQTVSVEVSTAEVLDLTTTPKTLVAAPGVGKIIQFLGATLVLDYNSIAYTETADNCAIRYTDGSGVIVSETIEMTGFIDQTADTVTNAIPKKDAIVAAAACVNQALVLDNVDSNFAAGNSPLTVVVAYKVVAALL